MKNSQQNLLIVLAVLLCGLCAFQWYQQTLQRNEIETLNRMVYDKSIAIRDCTNSIATLNHQVAEMDARITDLKISAKTNEQLVATQKHDLTRLQFISENLTNQITDYKNSVDALDQKLRQAYAGVMKQNEAITNLIQQRDDFVKKYNDEVQDRNNIVSNYNALVEQVKKTEGNK